jgi:hypothetical protein
MFDKFKSWILELFIDNALSPEQRWTVAGYLVGAAERYAEATATEIDDLFVLMVKAGVEDAEVRELVDSILDRIIQNATVEGSGKCSASALKADPEIIAHCTTVADLLNKRTGGRFNIDWAKVLEILALIFSKFILYDGQKDA